jgi:alpha-L-fucosidase 2
MANGKEMKQAAGVNPNPFFDVVKVKDPLISTEAKLNPVNLRQTYLYDLPTEAGKTYTIVIKKKL